MLIENQYIEVSWHSQSKKHYIKKGYIFTKYKDKFFVRAEDLTKTSKAKVKVICDYCGKEYEMNWYHYKLDVLDKNTNCCCYNCRHIKRYTNDIEKRRNCLYQKALKKCQENNYQFISPKDNIINNISIVQYQCPIHGLQEMRINNLIQGKKCPKCNKDNARNRYKLNKKEVERRIEQYGSIVLNSDDYINQDCKNLKIICIRCGKIFQTSLSDFTQHEGQICKNCSKCESKGEIKIRMYLESNNINFIQEKWFSDCRDIKPLPFDFYLPDYNICIEFDGEQHYKDKGNFSTSLKYTQHHDKIKTDYCNNKNITLLRIPYWDYLNIEKILDNNLISHKDIV